MSMSVTILGSGAASPTGHRRCSGQVVTIDGFNILIDCAEGTQTSIRHNRFRLQSFSLILISHMHGDHFFGLPGLLSTMHLCGRKEPVTIVAPKGAREVVEFITNNTGNHIDYPIVWQELDFSNGEQQIFENNRCTIYAFPLDHSVPTYDYRIREVRNSPDKQRSYAYCCDTMYREDIAEHVKDVALLCTECTFDNSLIDLATQRKHLTAMQAATIARHSSVGTLLLTHISARYKEPSLLLGQAKEIFPNVVMAEDNMTLSFPTNKQDFSDNILITKLER